MRRTSRKHQSQRWHRRLAPVLSALLLSVVPSTAPASANSGTLPVLGTLSRHPADSVAALGNRIKPTGNGDFRQTVGGTLVAVPQRNELWQVYPTASLSFTAAPTAIAVRDTTTLEITRKLDLPMPTVRAANGSVGGDWMHAFDGDRRVFFLGNNNLAGTSSWMVMEVDLETLAQRHFELGPPVVVGGTPTQGLRPAGMEYDPHSDALILMYGGIPVGAGAFMTILYRLDLRTGVRSDTVNSRLVRVCNGSQTPIDFGRTSQYGGIVTADFVYWACQRAGSIGGVVRIPRAELMNPASNEEIVAGPAYLDTAFADRAAGKIFLVTIASEIWAFDVAKMAFVGVVAGAAASAVNPPTGFGMDTKTGRLFIQSPSLGFGFAEGRFSPIPQARMHVGLKGNGQERIISDAAGGRAFVLTGGGSSRAAAYTIYNVGRAPVPPPPPDPDRNTADMAEKQGLTDSRFFSNGNGYGARTLLAKGITAVPPAPTAGQQAPTAEFFNNSVNSKCGYTDRELVVGRVNKAEYDTGSTAADAVGVDLDERTRLDLERLSRCDVVVKDAAQFFTGIFSTNPDVAIKCDEVRNEVERGKTCDSGHTWSTVGAYCTSSDGGERESRSPSRNEAPNKGEVSCPDPGGDLTASGTGGLSGPVSVGRAETKVAITRRDGGVRSTVTATANDIDIAGVVHVGEITSSAVSHAKGRPSSTPMSTHEVSVRGISLTSAGQTVMLCEEFRRVVGDGAKGAGIDSKNCNIKNALDLVNTALSGRGEFRLSSGLDDALLKGTPRGALTAVQKSSARQASDQALVGDRTNEVPGLELIVYNDNVIYGRARQIYQFAGVASAATYNIVPLPTGAGFDPDDGGGDDGGAGGDEDAAFDEGAFLPAGEQGYDLLSPEGFAAVPAVEGGAGTGFVDAVGRAIKALARGIRMFFTNPRHALLLLTAWGLFSLPPVLARRRRLLTLARSD